MVACLTDPEVGLTVEKVEEWCDNLPEALLGGWKPYPSCSQSRSS
jgi:hypothetical protein